MTQHTSSYERYQDLLIERAIQGLSGEELVEMNKLKRQFPRDDDDSFEQVVAALDVALNKAIDDTSVELPAPLRSRLLRQADNYLEHQHEDAGGMKTDSDGDSHDTIAGGPSPAKSESAWTVRERLFAFVTAASLLIAVVSFATRPERPPPAPPALSLAEQRTRLIETAADVHTTKWEATPDPAAKKASGDVVWSDQQQQGFMRFTGLPVNDPEEQQYQLWIFDFEQSDETPVDGGVFNITSTGEVIVPIDAKLRISKAKMFAVTIEKPNGVPRSERERLPLLAKVDFGR